jgi:hypothetical protein
MSRRLLLVVNVKLLIKKEQPLQESLKTRVPLALGEGLKTLGE